MQTLTRTPVDQLVADPFMLGRYGDFASVLRATLLHPSVLGRLDELERYLLEDCEQEPCPVIHRFGPGVYIREIKMPAGAFVIGAYHKRPHLNLMLSGRVTVLNQDGSTAELVAPMMFVGQPGKKVGYMHEDVVWQNIYATDETDVEKLEAENIVRGDPWLEDKAKRKPTLQEEFDRLDYWRVLEEYGIPHEVARQESENADDLMPFPYGGYKVMVTDSAIEGRGLFATADIAPDETIAPARIGAKRTPAGRYVNHSANPNAHFVLLPNNDLNLVAIRPILGMRGGRPGDEITIDYRHSHEIRKLPCQA